jgi:hypothetical protein
VPTISNDEAPVAAKREDNAHQELAERHKRKGPDQEIVQPAKQKKKA